MIYTYNHSVKLLDAENVTRPSEDPKWLFEHFKQHIQPQKGHILLDLGCGHGVITLLLAKAFPECHVHGIDIQEKLIKQAKKQAKLNNLENCTFECLDILGTDFTEKYDHTLSNPPYHMLEAGFESVSGSKLLAHGMSLESMEKWLQIGLQLTAKGGTFTFIHHMQHLSAFKELLEPYKHDIEPIQTHPTKPAKRVLVHIQK